MLKQTFTCIISYVDILIEGYYTEIYGVLEKIILGEANQIFSSRTQ